MKSDTHIRPGKAALRLGVNPRTVARWADEGRFGPVTVTEAGGRLLDVAAVDRVATELADGRVAS